jgi:hypothetical protein
LKHHVYNLTIVDIAVRLKTVSRTLAILRALTFQVAMTRSTRWISLVWLALVLNVLSPVIGYARAPGAQAPLSVELCHAAGAQNVVIDLGGSHDSAPKSHLAVPHCVYCPGFAANFALGASVPFITPPVQPLAYARAMEPEAVFVRRSVRVAQPRAPPVPSI